MKKEKRIYLKQLFYEALLKWKSILICMICFAVLANIFFCAKYYMAIQRTVSQQNETNQEIDLSVYKNALSESDAKLVEDYFQMYLRHKESYDKILNYYNKSIKINLDPGCVPAVNVEYRVDNCSESDDFVNTLKVQIENNETAAKIINELDLDTENSYIWELVDMEDMRDEASETNSNVVVKEEKNNSFVILVQVIAPDTEMAKQISAIIDEEIGTKIEKLKNKYGNFSIDKLSQVSTSIVDNELLMQQQDYSGRLNNLKSYFENLQSSLTDGQKNYYDALISNNEIEDEEMQSNNNEKVAVEKPEMQYISIKYIIVGLFAGFIISAAYFCLPYIFGNKLTVAAEISDYYGLTLLGSVEESEKKKKIDKKIDLLFNKNKYKNTKEEKIQLICTQIFMALQKSNIDNVYLTSTLATNNIIDIEKKIADNLTNLKVQVAIGNSLLYDQSSLKGLMEMKSVVFVEEMGVSDLQDIYKEVDICNNFNVLSVGAVILGK